MFTEAKHSRPEGPPRGSTFRESDWRTLAAFWHPVAQAAEVAHSPVSARLLDVDLVLWRNHGGVIRAARDICPHRGSRLSRGWMADGRLVCPMHGLHFDGAGVCTLIPARGDGRGSERMRLDTFHACERHGLVWVCMASEPAWPLPEWEPLADPGLDLVHASPDRWRAAASRHTENFNDVAHFAWVHTESFGGDRSAPVPAYEVEEVPDGLRFSFDYLEGFNRFKDGVPGNTREVIYHYHLTFPFATLLTVAPKGSDARIYVADVACPVSAHESLIFQVLADTTGVDDAAYWVRDSQLINDEDRPVVEGQRPEDLPLDLQAELHIPADRMSIAYRRGLVRHFGLGAPIAS